MKALSKTVGHLEHHTPSQYVQGSAVFSVGLVVACLVAWIHIVVQADMGHEHGVQLYEFPIYIVGWVIMLTAMMLPTESVYVKVYASLLRNRGVSWSGQAILLSCFMTGYGIAWTIYGTAAFMLDGTVRECWSRVVGWVPSESSLLSSALFLAGIYQISPLKRACLSSCRSPLSHFTRQWKTGYSGSLRMGLAHGLMCVGCCWALMALMFITGTVGMAWVGLLTLMMFAEKVLPFGHRLTIVFAVCFILLGVWVALSPESVPSSMPIERYRGGVAMLAPVQGTVNKGTASVPHNGLPT
jgi:predicted metal-binding membrane protein